MVLGQYNLERWRLNRMKIGPIITGIATGMVAGAVVTALAGNAMANPKTRRTIEKATDKVCHTARDISNKIL